MSQPVSGHQGEGKLTFTHVVDCASQAWKVEWGWIYLLRDDLDLKCTEIRQ